MRGTLSVNHCQGGGNASTARGAEFAVARQRADRELAEDPRRIQRRVRESRRRDAGYRRHPPGARSELGNDRASACRIAAGGMEAVCMKSFLESHANLLREEEIFKYL